MMYLPNSEIALKEGCVRHQTGLWNKAVYPRVTVYYRGVKSVTCLRRRHAVSQGGMGDCKVPLMAAPRGSDSLEASAEGRQGAGIVYARGFEQRRGQMRTMAKCLLCLCARDRLFGEREWAAPQYSRYLPARALTPKKGKRVKARRI
jgi:hypothetical protein